MTVDVIQMSKMMMMQVAHISVGSTDISVVTSFAKFPTNIRKSLSGHSKDIICDDEDDDDRMVMSMMMI